MGARHFEEVEDAGVDALRHAELEGTVRCVDLADGAQPRSHQGCCASSACGVVCALEELQCRVTPEFEGIAAEVHGQTEQLGKRAVERLGNLFGADSPLFGEPLAQCRETRDVHEEHRAFALLVAKAFGPGLQQARDEGCEGIVVAGGLQGHAQRLPPGVVRSAATRGLVTAGPDNTSR